MLLFGHMASERCFLPAVFALASVFALVSLPLHALGQSAWHEPFEGPETSWRDSGGNAQYGISGHIRQQGQARSGDGCERLKVTGTAGTYVHVSHDVGRPWVIEELSPSVWVKSDRAGLQLVSRVALPRTEDPRTGRPVTALVYGPSYTDVGRWQRLTMTDLPRLLARQIRILRAELRSNVDSREAYLDAVLLNVYGGPGTTNVWIDDLEVAGYVASSAVARAQGNMSHPGAGSTVPAETDRPRLQLAGSILQVDGQPLFARAIQYRGEPLEFLRQLGFNTVWLDRSASAELLSEAARLGMWLVCPPPSPAPAEIGPEYDRVLAWDLGRQLAAEQLDQTRAWAKQIRLAEGRRWRPLICQPESQLMSYSRHVDLMLIGRRPLGTSLELADYATWLRRRPLLARSSTLIWNTIQTQPSAALREQLTTIEPEFAAPLTVPSEQIRLLTYLSLSSGCRGLLFESQTPLTADDPDTRQRAMTLELLNLELRPIEPWLAGGTLVTQVKGNRPEVTGAVLRSQRSRLLLAFWTDQGAQYTPGQAAGNRISLVVPGVPVDQRAYGLSPGALQPLWPKRVTGGSRVMFDEFGLTGQVVFSQDPLAISHLTARAAQIAPRAAQLQRDLAAAKLHRVQQIAGQCGPRVSQISQAPGWMDAARKSMQHCDGQLAAHQYRGVYLYAQRTMRSLRLLERAFWEASVEGLSSPVSSPASQGFDTLPWHARLMDRIARSQFGAALLPGGDFEDLHVMQSTGWNHFRHEVAGLQTTADLVPEAAYSGRTGLRLTVSPADPENPPAMVETPPVWITSPPVAVEAGQLVCIHGWVQIPGAILGSVDGLMVVDSLTGEALAERIGKTEGWKQFVLYRAVPRSGQMTVTLALTGLGEARIDDVTIQPLNHATADRITRLQ